MFGPPWKSGLCWSGGVHAADRQSLASGTMRPLCKSRSRCKSLVCKIKNSHAKLPSTNQNMSLSSVSYFYLVSETVTIIFKHYILQRKGNIKQLHIESKFVLWKGKKKSQLVLRGLSNLCNCWKGSFKKSDGIFGFTVNHSSYSAAAGTLSRDFCTFHGAEDLSRIKSSPPQLPRLGKS